ncbi:MAG: mechanosensitive ion channel family protein [Holophaga sp.]|nr:mechanosensitive ion channel family protein [Holophaga sp.]
MIPMNILDRIYLGNSLLTWFLAIGVVILVLASLLAIRWMIFHRLARLAQKTETELDDLMVEVLGNTRIFSLLFIAFYAGTRVLSITPFTEGVCRTVLVLGLLLQAALWANKAVSSVLQRLIKKRMEDDAAGATALSITGFAAKVSLWSIFLLLALDNIGVNITGLVAGLGIGGIAVALALQNVLGDLFASLSIVLDKPFAIGDFLIVGDFLGTVEHIGIKTTRLRSLSGEQLIFSNTDLLQSRIRNFKRMSERRVVFSLSVTYQTPHEKVASMATMIRSLIEAQPGVRFDRAHFKEFGDSALVFEIVYFLLDPDYNIYMDTQQAINLALFRQFETEGISFAYPTQTLFLARETPAPNP